MVFGCYLKCQYRLGRIDTMHFLYILLGCPTALCYHNANHDVNLHIKSGTGFV